MSKIARWEMVELLIPAAAGTRIPFLDQPQMRTQKGQDVYIKQIKVFGINSYSGSQAIQGVPGVTAAELAKAVMVLYVQGEERIHNVPLLHLVTIASDPAAFIPYNVLETEFDDLQKVDWTKSYVNFSIAPAGGPYVIPFGVTYLLM